MAFTNAVDANQQGTQYLSTAGAWSGVDGSTAGKVLTSNGTGVAPSFQTATTAYFSLTPYIVGADVHSQFTTIQAAITQAVTDGASATTPANIYIKPGVYTENPVLADGINLIGFSSDSRTVGGNSTAAPTVITNPVVRITGQVTYLPTTAATTSASMTNITVHPTAANTDAVVFTGNPAALATDFFALNNCALTGTGTGVGLNLIASGNPDTYIYNCYLSKLLDNSNSVLSSSGCYVLGTTVLNDTQSRTFNFCTFHGAVTITTANGPTQFYNCQLNSTTTVSAGAGFLLYDCQTLGLITSAAVVNYANLSFSGDSGIAGANGPLNQQFGNTILAQQRGSGSVSISTSSIYYGNTGAGTGTLSLSNTGVANGQVFIIKDENGNAGTNNLTINVTGGVKTIDGAASQTISVNFGVIRVIYDGTNFFTW